MKNMNKIRSYNNLCSQLEASGFIACSGYVWKGNAFDGNTWHPEAHKMRIARIVWNGCKWELSPV
jgi:hypothetical protein